jgi:hypothetical protein
VGSVSTSMRIWRAAAWWINYRLGLFQFFAPLAHARVVAPHFLGIREFPTDDPA